MNYSLLERDQDNCFYSISSGRGDLLAYANILSDYCVFHSINKMELSTFIGINNILRKEARDNSSHSLSISKNNSSNFKVYIGSESRISSLIYAEKPMGSLEDICNQFNIASNSVDFLRFDNELFSMSHEGDLTAISTKYNIEDSIVTFIELTSGVQRSTLWKKETSSLLVHLPNSSNGFLF